MKIRIYLAGDVSIFQRWRPLVVDALKDMDGNIEILSPYDKCGYSYKTHRTYSKKDRPFMGADLLKVDAADIIFVYMRKCKSKHIGTSCEIGRASRDATKHIIYVNDMSKRMAHYYEFAEELADKTFRKLDAGIDYLKDLLAEMFYKPTSKEG